MLIDPDEKKLAEACDDIGPDAFPLTIELFDGKAMSARLPAIRALVGELDIFRANAGAYVGSPTAEGAPDVWEKLLNININAAFRSLSAVLPYMIDRKTGDILFTSSVAGVVPVVWEPIYSSSKFALQAFLDTTRRQVSQYGIWMGAVLPGPVATTLFGDWPKAMIEEALANGSLMQVCGEAEAVRFMLSAISCSCPTASIFNHEGRLPPLARWESLTCPQNAVPNPAMSSVSMLAPAPRAPACSI